LLDQLLSGTDAAAALQQGGLLDDLKKALAERALNAEMDHHLGGEAGAGNSRNGYGRKTVLTDTGGRIALEVPRDRQGSFDPQLIAKYQRRFPGFDEKIVSLYARGLSTREIAGHVLELYGVEVSPDLVSAVTDAVFEEIATWQARPLEPAPGQCPEAADLLRRAAGEDPRRGVGPQRGGAHCARRQSRRRQGDPRPVARAE
jgi:transposase-like protein